MQSSNLRLSRSRVGALAASCVVLAIIPVALADVVVSDHFDADVIDPAWTVSFDLATGWTYELEASHLAVSDIAFAEFHGGFSKVALSQDFEALDDFILHMTLAWDSEGQDSAMQVLMVVLRDSSGMNVAWASYYDIWDQEVGRIAAGIGESEYLGQDGLPHSAGASFLIMRNTGTVSIFWEDVEILTRTATAPAERIELWFGTVALANVTFGSLSVGFIECAGDPTTPVDTTTWGNVKRMYR